LKKRNIKLKGKLVEQVEKLQKKYSSPRFKGVQFKDSTNFSQKGKPIPKLIINQYNTEISNLKDTDAQIEYTF